MRECSHCGAENASAANYCRRCGREQQARIAAPPPPPVRPGRKGFPLFRVLLVLMIVFIWLSVIRGSRRASPSRHFTSPREFCPPAPVPVRPLPFRE